MFLLNASVISPPRPGITEESAKRQSSAAAAGDRRLPQSFSTKGNTHVTGGHARPAADVRWLKPHDTVSGGGGGSTGGLPVKSAGSVKAGLTSEPH